MEIYEAESWNTFSGEAMKGGMSVLVRLVRDSLHVAHFS